MKICSNEWKIIWLIEILKVKYHSNKISKSMIFMYNNIKELCKVSGVVEEYIEKYAPTLNMTKN